MHLINEPFPTDILHRFKMDCLKFLIELYVQVKRRFSLSENSLIAKLSILDPAIASNTSLSPARLTHLISKFPNLVKSEKVNKLDDQCRSYRLTAKELPLQVLNDNIPRYWYDISSIKDGLGNSKFALLSQFMLNLTCLSHFSACV